MPSSRAHCFSPTKAYLTSVIPPEVKNWNHGQGSVTLGANPNLPCPTAAFTKDQHKQGVYSSEDQMYCSCRKRHVVESTAREMPREAERKLIMDSTTNCLCEKKKKQKPNVSSCWLWLTTTLNRKEALKQGEKWPLISDCYLTLLNSLLLHSPALPTHKSIDTNLPHAQFCLL